MHENVRYGVQDLRRFRQLLERLLAARGSQERAAAALGLTQGHFSKLLRSRPDQDGPFTVSGRVVGRLQSACGDSVWEIFVSPPARRLLAGAQVWRESFRFPPYEIGTAHQRVAVVLHRRGCGKLLGDFLDWARRLGHEDTRVGLAYLRVLDPLLDSTRTAGIERSCAEMSDAELRRYVRAALARERILLRREPDVPRAQRLAAAATGSRHQPAPRTPTRARKAGGVPPQSADRG